MGLRHGIVGTRHFVPWRVPVLETEKYVTLNIPQRFLVESSKVHFFYMSATSILLSWYSDFAHRRTGSYDA